MENNRIDLIIFIRDVYELVFYTEKNDFSCVLPFNINELDKKIEKVNEVLKGIVTTRAYRENIEIPKNICHEDLKSIADLDLWNWFFYGSGPRKKDNIDCEEELRRKSHEQPLILTIRTRNEQNKEFLFPWALLYDKQRQSKEEKIDVRHFWGFKHIIQQVPRKRFVRGSIIESSNLQFSFNVNSNIDSQYQINCVKKQHEFFDRIKGPCFDKITRDTEKQVEDAFGEKRLHDAIIYFYCHAAKSSDWYIELTTPKERLYLETISRWCGIENTFTQEPLVFLNACESAGISPLFYEGFLPYFLLKGARGIIGTLSKIPAIFATEFGLKFFDLFLRGEKADLIISQLRKEFLLKHNLLGLYYTSYCNIDLSLNSPILK